MHFLYKFSEAIQEHPVKYTVIYSQFTSRSVLNRIDKICLTNISAAYAELGILLGINQRQCLLSGQKTKWFIKVVVIQKLSLNTGYFQAVG